MSPWMNIRLKLHKYNSYLLYGMCGIIFSTQMTMVYLHRKGENVRSKFQNMKSFELDSASIVNFDSKSFLLTSAHLIDFYLNPYLPSLKGDPMNFLACTKTSNILHSRFKVCGDYHCKFSSLLSNLRTRTAQFCHCKNLCHPQGS